LLLSTQVLTAKWSAGVSFLREEILWQEQLCFSPQVSTVDQVDRLFDFIAPLVQDAEGADAADEPDDEVHIFQ